MDVSVYAAYNHVKSSDIRNKTAIVIDVLRATTTIVQSLKNGCRIIVPVLTPEDAVNIKRSNQDESTILGGERKALKIAGFDLGNSPLEYERDIVMGKTLMLCTTNGTQAILKARDASNILIAALSNISAVAQKAVEYDKDIAVICAGTKERFSADDIITAGALIDRLKKMEIAMAIDDLAMVAYNLYDRCRGDKHNALSGTYHYEFLKSLGMKDDLDFCLMEDTADIVPEYSEGVISIIK